MAKKSHTGHKPMPSQAKGAARRPQAPAGATSSATLVRAPSADNATGAASVSAPASPSASNVVADRPAASKPTSVAAKSASPSGATRPAPKPAAPKPAAAAPERRTAVAERPATTASSPAPRPATPKPAATPSKPAAAAPKPAAVSTREQNQRLARARATQRARQANLISAENYSYVLGDLKLIVGLALSALIVLIALTFVLPH